MENKEIANAIERMVRDVNEFSKSASEAKKRNLEVIEQDYISRILAMSKAMEYLGYMIYDDGFSDGYSHYKAIKVETY